MFHGLDTFGRATFDRRLGRPFLVPREPCGRLSLVSGSAVVTTSQAAKSTIYYPPYKGNVAELYDTTVKQWVPRVLTERSVAVPSTLFRLFDSHLYWDGDSCELELVNWDQSTAALTAATAATPSVITSTAHGLSNGDLVGLAGLDNTVGTDATNGLNGTVWTVANAAANTFEAQGSQCAALVASTTGTWYKIPNTRTTALTTQDGRYVKTGDASRLYLGTGMTTGTSGQCETVFGTTDTAASWLLWNYYHRQPLTLRYADTTGNWTYTTAVRRPANGRGKLARLGFVVGIQETEIDAEAVHAATDSSAVAGSTTVQTDIMIDRFTGATPDSTRSGVISGTGFVNPLIARYAGFPGVGFHFLGWSEISDAAGGGTTTWYGDAGLPTPLTGIMARWGA